MINFLNIYAALGFSLAILGSYNAYRAMFMGYYGSVKTARKKSFVEKQRKDLEEIKNIIEPWPEAARAIFVAIGFMAAFVIMFAFWPVLLVGKAIKACRRG